MTKRWTVPLRDGSRVTLRPVEASDRDRIAASFVALSEESRYRRFLTTTSTLSPAGLDFLVDVDHHDHEAIVALDASGTDLVGAARYIRSDEPDVAEVAVTVVDAWQGRGLGRALLTRLTARAREEGITRFSALVLPDNRQALGLVASLGVTRHHAEAGAVELFIDLPPQRGLGRRLQSALRTAASGSITPVRVFAQRIALRVSAPENVPVPPARPIRTIVAIADTSDPDGRALGVALTLAARLGASVHAVSAYEKADSRSAEVLAGAEHAARAKGVPATAHAGGTDAAEALLAVAREHDADLLVVSGDELRGASRFSLSVANIVSHRAPCSVLLVHGSSPVDAAGPRDRPVSSR